MEAKIENLTPMTEKEIAQFYELLLRINKAQSLYDLRVHAATYVNFDCSTFKCGFGRNHFWVKHQNAMEKNMIFVEF